MKIPASPATLSGPVSFREMRDTMEKRMTGLEEDIHKDLPAWDGLTEERLVGVRALVDSVTPENSSRVKKEMRTALWELRQALESGAAESLGAHPGSRLGLRRSLEKLRTVALDNSFEGAAHFPREEVAVRCGIDMIPNFREVGPGVLRGGQPTQEGMDWLVHERGVKDVVDLRAADKQSPFCQWDRPRWPNVKMHAIEVEDYETPTLDQVRQFIHLANKASTENPVFVHCKAGIGRTGTMVACWRISQGWKAEDAIMQERLHSYDASFRQEQFVRDFEQLYNSGQFRL